MSQMEQLETWLRQRLEELWSGSVEAANLELLDSGTDAFGVPYLLTERLSGETIPRRLLREERPAPGKNFWTPTGRRAATRPLWTHCTGGRCPARSAADKLVVANPAHLALPG